MIGECSNNMSNDAPSEIRPRSSITIGEASVRATQFSLISAYLFILYLCFVWLVVGTLSAQGFQDKVQNSNNGKRTTLTVPSLVRQKNEIETREAELSSLKTELSAANNDFKKNSAALEAAQREENKINDLLDTDYLKLGRQLFELDPSDEKFRGDPNYLSMKSYLTFKSKQFDEISVISDLQKSIKSLRVTLLDRENKRLALGREVNIYHGKKNSLNTDVRALESLIENLVTEQDRDLLNELGFLDRVYGYSLLATMPTQMLTLLLTMAMGALGSMLYITTDYFRSEVERTFSWYVFRPILGMVTAIAVFVLFKGGQLTISGSGASQALSEGLNPFFISFLGIISGLLSEQAIQRIRRAGTSVFRSSAEDRERWAVAVGAEMQAQSLTVDTLRAYLRASQETIENWVSQKEPVPPTAQQLISALLKKPVRELFSDLAPK